MCFWYFYYLKKNKFLHIILVLFYFRFISINLWTKQWMESKIWMLIHPCIHTERELYGKSTPLWPVLTGQEESTTGQPPTQQTSQQELSSRQGNSQGSNSTQNDIIQGDAKENSLNVTQVIQFSYYIIKWDPVITGKKLPTFKRSVYLESREFILSCVLVREQMF